MYRTYWGLRENPFASTYDPRFFFLTEDHEAAVRRFLEVYTENKGVMMLLGPVGVGKTYLCKLIASQLDALGIKIAHMITPRLNAEMFCHEVARKLGLDVGPHGEISAQNLYERMSARDGACPAVLILDEAQTITDETTFEAIRIMLDFDKNGRILHTLLMSGQETLEDRLRAHRSLNQRVVVRHSLKPFTEAESSEYIDFRLKAAGAATQIFDREAKTDIYKTSRGLPRVINALCDTAMTIAADERFLKINPGLVVRASKRIAPII